MWPLDHIVLVVDDLARGEAVVAGLLGHAADGGGQHPTMGTWNRLWRLGSAFLELLAVDPAAPHPGRPRWFALDRPRPGPVLAGWVLRVADLDAALAACPLAPGRAETHRRDALTWRLSVPASGESPGGGTLPLLIAWPEGAVLPPDRLPDRGLALDALAVSSPEAAAIRALPLPQGIAVSEGPPRLSAVIRRADGGAVTLS